MAYIEQRADPITALLVIGYNYFAFGLSVTSTLTPFIQVSIFHVYPHPIPSLPFQGARGMMHVPHEKLTFRTHVYVGDDQASV